MPKKLNGTAHPKGSAAPISPEYGWEAMPPDVDVIDRAKAAETPFVWDAPYPLGPEPINETPAITRHEVWAAFDTASQAFDEEVKGFESAHAALEAEIERDTRILQTIDAQERGEADVGMPTESFRSVEQALAQRHARSGGAISEQGLGIVLGVVVLVAGFAGSAAIEYALFYSLYAADMSDRFGEVAASTQGIVSLLALQALVILVVVKFFMTTPGRKAALLGFAFLGSALFLGGAVLHRGLAAMQMQSETASGGLSWAEPAQAASGPSPVITILETVSNFLLALPFLITPIAAALMVSFGWSAFAGGLNAVMRARRFRQVYDRRSAGMAACDDLKMQIRRRRHNRALQIMAPVRALIAKEIDAARDLKRRAGDARLAGIGQMVTASLPGAATTPLMDVEAAERRANAIILTLGGGFLERCYADWCAARADDRLS